jgi:hypothetical protein
MFMGFCLPAEATSGKAKVGPKAMIAAVMCRNRNR